MKIPPLLKITSLYKFILLILAFTAVAGCHFDNKKKLNRRITLWRKDKIPYGDYYTYENLHYLFPSAKMTLNKTSPARNVEFYPASYSTTEATPKSKKAYVIISPQVIPNEYEISAMMSFVGDGNYIFISTFYISDSLLKSINAKTTVDRDRLSYGDTLRVKIKNPVDYSRISFQYPGNSYGSYASTLDSEYATILGTDETGHANFIKFTYKGDGAVFLHLAPMTFTNFFLLYKDNKSYYDLAFSYLPKSITEIKWDDYFRYPNYGNFSSLKFLLSNPSFRWAFWLLLLLFLLIYLFESKRKQRMIPAISPLRNTSLDFVTTIGRLYYQRRDNLNLATKMSIHFLGQVRTKYNMQTSFLDQEFTDRLAYKSGYNKDGVAKIIEYIKVIQQQQFISDESLITFNKEIEQFYKQT
ncbi:MAG TPA: DUF4350 domain-containing protein [Puia sp.]|nr:DUF4350 domain-containing protein [Puia sp.]